MSNGSQGGRALDFTKIEAAYVGYFTAFNDRLKASKNMYNEIADVVETDNVLDRQLWLSQHPKMRRWVGPKQISKFRGESHPISTEPYEASVEVSKHDILNDKLGLYKKRIGQMADAYGEALDELAIMMLAAGASVASASTLGTTYDGQSLIDTDHTALSVGGTNQSNRVTGALTAIKFNEAMQKFLEMKDENGTPVAFPSGKMKLIVGPANRSIARDIIGTEFDTDGTTNLDRGIADLIVHPRITAGTFEVKGKSVTLTGTEWLLLPAGSSACIISLKRAPEFLAVEDGEFVFRTGKFLYGIEAEFGGDYGLWQEVVGGPGA